MRPHLRTSFLCLGELVRYSKRKKESRVPGDGHYSCLSDIWTLLMLIGCGASRVSTRACDTTTTG